MTRDLDHDLGDADGVHPEIGKVFLRIKLVLRHAQGGGSDLPDFPRQTLRNIGFRRRCLCFRFDLPRLSTRGHARPCPLDQFLIEKLRHTCAQVIAGR